MKLKRIEKTINSTEEIHQITFDEHLRPRIPPARKQGRPRYKWATKGIEEYWDQIRSGWKDQYSDINKWKQDWKDYDPKCEKQNAIIKQYASAAIPVPEEEWSKFPNKETIWIEGVNYTKEKSEKEKKKEEYEANREKRRILGQQRQAEALNQHSEQITIPLPSYSYGAVRRSRFAFGRITPLQARKNTALQFRNEQEPTILEQDNAQMDTIETTEEPADHPEEPSVPPTFLAEEEMSEEDFFQFDEAPNKEDCA